MKDKTRIELAEMHKVSMSAAEVNCVGVDQAIVLAHQLIAVYDMPYNERSRRDAAANLVARLATRHSGVLELVIKNAEEYAKSQAIDDADPYSPNSFDVLSSIGTGNERVLQFLEQIGKDEKGIQRRHTTGALCKPHSLA